MPAIPGMINGGSLLRSPSALPGSTRALTSTTAGAVDYADYQPLDTQLTDLAGLSYSGNANKVVAVNSGETGFELVTASGGDTVISPSQLTASQNDWSPTGLSTATIIRLSGDSSLREITSIAAQSGRRLVLENVGSNTVMIRDESAALGTAANRIICGGYDLPLFPGGSMILIYDGTSSRWRVEHPNAFVVPLTRNGLYIAEHNIPLLGTTRPFNTAAAVNGAGSGAGGIVDTTIGHFVGYFETGTTTTGRGGIAGNNGTNYRLVSTRFWRLGFRLKAPVASDATDTYTLRCGLNDVVNGDATDGVYIRYTHSVNSGNWELVLRNNSSESAVNLSAGPTANTWDSYAIVISPTKVEVFENGTSIGSTTTLTNLPTARDTDIGMTIIKSAGTTSRLAYVYGIELIGYNATP